MSTLTRGIRDGGWVIICAAVIFAALVTWALAPAVLKMVSRPPGDGVTLSSYEFDLSNLRLPSTATLEPAMLHRDMVPVLDAPPAILSADDVVAAADTRNRYLVSDDAVIGVTSNGESRVYPLSILHVHEVIHDELGGVPIAVTWHWPSASPRIFDRRIDGDTRLFGVSGLVAGGNQAVYLRNADKTVGGESLFSQLLGRSITGPPMEIEAIPFRFTNWTTWLDEHPDTTVAGGLPAMKKRYKHGDPSAYYRASGLLFDTPIPSGGLPAKAPMVLLGSGHGDRLMLSEADVQAAATAPLGLSAASTPPRIEVAHPPSDTDIRHALFHSMHALGLDTDNR
jgi:hypothetical protein